MRRAAFILAVLAGACSSDSAANVAGTYTIALTIQQNECGILGNDPGTSSSGVTVVVTQEGSKVTAQVQGAAALGLGLATAAPPSPAQSRATHWTCRSAEPYPVPVELAPSPATPTWWERWLETCSPAA